MLISEKVSTNYGWTMFSVKKTCVTTFRIEMCTVNFIFFPTTINNGECEVEKEIGMGGHRLS